jgi:hypothetical protein
LSFIKLYETIKISNDGEVYPFKIQEVDYNETGFLLKTGNCSIDSRMISIFTKHTPSMTFYKLSWSILPSREWIIKIISNAVGFTETAYIIDKFNPGDVFIMIFAENSYFDTTVKKFFIYTNKLYCPDYTKEDIIIKPNVYHEKSTYNSYTKTLRLDLVDFVDN